MSSSLLKDDSWIRKDEDEYEVVDRDPNFGSSVLSQYRSTDSLNRFSGSQDELPTSSYSKSRVSYTQSSPSYRRTDEPNSSTTTTTVSKDGKITETTITSQSLRKSPSKTSTFSERVQSFSKGAEDKLYDTLIPNAIKDETGDRPEDELYDTLLSKGISSAQSSSSYSTSSMTKRETVTMESSVAPLTSSYTSRSYTDEIPSARVTSYSISNNLPSDDYSSKSGSYYYSSSTSTASKPTYEYTSISSPTEYSSSTYRSTSLSDTNPMTSVKTYTSPDRTTLERELCTYCHKPFNGDGKMILDEMKISCHTFCFKCEVCNGTLGHLKAGDCMWVYNHMVHCQNCFDVTREKWRH